MKNLLIATGLALLATGCAAQDPLKPWKPIKGEEFVILDLPQPLAQKVCARGASCTPEY